LKPNHTFTDILPLTYEEIKDFIKSK